jgi:hypothetical protein
MHCRVLMFLAFVGGGAQEPQLFPIPNSAASIGFRRVERMYESDNLIGSHISLFEQIMKSRPRGLPATLASGNLDRMSRVAEIETAIERLQPTEVTQLTAWLNEYQQMIQASSEIFAMYDREETSCNWKHPSRQTRTSPRSD